MHLNQHVNKLKKKIHSYMQHKTNKNKCKCNGKKYITHFVWLCLRIGTTNVEVCWSLIFHQQYTSLKFLTGNKR